VRAHYPLSLHAVGLSLGSAAGVDGAHLARLHQLALRLRPGLVSDHLSWSVVNGHYLPDLLPLPYTEEALAIVCRNVSQVQETLGRQLLIENPSTYLHYAATAMSEAEFLAAVVVRTGCGVLLQGWCQALDPRSVGELHLAGHAIVSTSLGEELRIDDHGDRVCTEVWSLYASAIEHFGALPTLLEWDTRLPEFAVLQDEARHAQDLLHGARSLAHARYA
jgi:uncharacterized protein